jgi:hypothetical protein
MRRKKVAAGLDGNFTIRFTYVESYLFFFSRKELRQNKAHKRPKKPGKGKAKMIMPQQ